MNFVCLACRTRYLMHFPTCRHCMTDGLITSVSTRERAEVTSKPQQTTAAELIRSSYRYIDFIKYNTIKVTPGSLALIVGRPSAGKSTMGMSWLDSYPGPTVFYSVEEGLGSTVVSKLQRLAISRKDFHIQSACHVDALCDLIKKTKAGACLIDSVTTTTMTPQDLRAILNNTPLKVLMGTVQVTKDGSAAGPNSLLHEADIVIEAIEGCFRLQKSRHQDLSTCVGEIDFGSKEREGFKTITL